MKKQEENIIRAFKRLIHVLTTGKRTPYEYGDTILYRAEVHILEIIGRKSGITASDIVDDMKVTKGAVSQIISKLCKKELLQKRSKADNRKVQELYLTRKGMEVLFYHSEREKELMKTLIPALRAFRSEDIDKFTGIINAVADFIKKSFR